MLLMLYLIVILIICFITIIINIIMTFIGEIRITPQPISNWP